MTKLLKNVAHWILSIFSKNKPLQKGISNEVKKDNEKLQRLEFTKHSYRYRVKNNRKCTRGRRVQVIKGVKVIYHR